MSTDFRLRSLGRRPDSYDDDGISETPWRRRSASSPTPATLLSSRAIKKNSRQRSPVQKAPSFGSDIGQVSDEEEEERTSAPHWRETTTTVYDRNGCYPSAGSTTPDQLASRGASWQSDESDDDIRSERLQSERQDRLLSAGLRGGGGPTTTTNSKIHTTTTTEPKRTSSMDVSTHSVSPPPVMDTSKLEIPDSPVSSRRRSTNADATSNRGDQYGIINSPPPISSRRRANSKDYLMPSGPPPSSRRRADSKEYMSKKNNKSLFRKPQNRPSEVVTTGTNSAPLSQSSVRRDRATAATASLNPYVSFHEKDQQRPPPEDEDDDILPDELVYEEDGWAAETSASDENVAKVVPIPLTKGLSNSARNGTHRRSGSSNGISAEKKSKKTGGTTGNSALRATKHPWSTPSNNNNRSSNPADFDESSYTTPKSKMRKHAPTALDLYGLGSAADDDEESYDEESMSFLPPTLTPDSQVRKGSIMERRSISAPSALLDSPALSSISSSGNPFDDSFSEFVQSAVRPDDMGMQEKALSNEPVSAADYLTKDQELKTIFNFAMEHRILTKAALELLGELGHDRHVDMDSVHVVKAGPLKKASHLVRGVWKVKYVEVRKGMFSYYEDAMSKDGAGLGGAAGVSGDTVEELEDGEQLVRKNIPLHASNCVCRPVKVNHKAMKLPLGAGAIFELTVEGGPRRFWMANSRDERQAWIRAIQDAMMGKSAVSRGDEDHGGGAGAVGHNGRRPNTVNAKSPFKKDLEKYLRIQKDIRGATDKDTYVSALITKMGVGTSLKVPVIWIEQNSMFEDPDKIFKEEGVSSSVDQLWKDLFRDTVRVNGELFQGGSGHAPERIIGALTKEILSYDRSIMQQSGRVGFVNTASPNKRRKNEISEVQALAYARDILLAGNRTRSGGDSYYCVDALCRNADLVVATPRSAEAEPLQVKISQVVPEGTSMRNLISYSLNDRNGWLRTRSKPHKPWKRRFFVLSEGTLSYYEKALPRPHGLRGQLKLSDAQLHACQRKEDRRVAFTPRGSRRKLPLEDTEETLAEPKVIKGHFIISIASRDGLHDRQLLFEDETKFLMWAQSFEGCIKILNQRNVQRHRSVPNSPVASARTASPSRGGDGNKGMRFRMQRLRDELGITDQSERGVLLTGRGALLQHAGMLGYEKKELAARLRVISNQMAGGKGQATVKVTVQASTTYNICTLDPQGDESEDIWAIMRANFMQSFKVSGGPHGKIMRGEEVVQVSVVKCTEVSKAYVAPKEATSNNKLPRIPIPRKLRVRSTSLSSNAGNELFQQGP